MPKVLASFKKKNPFQINLPLNLCVCLRSEHCGMTPIKLAGRTTQRTACILYTDPRLGSSGTVEIIMDYRFMSNVFPPSSTFNKNYAPLCNLLVWKQQIRFMIEYQKIKITQVCLLVFSLKNMYLFLIYFNVEFFFCFCL